MPEELPKPTQHRVCLPFRSSWGWPPGTSLGRGDNGARESSSIACPLGLGDAEREDSQQVPAKQTLGLTLGALGCRHATHGKEGGVCQRSFPSAGAVCRDTEPRPSPDCSRSSRQHGLRRPAHPGTGRAHGHDFPLRVPRGQPRGREAATGTGVPREMRFQVSLRQR